MAKAPKGVTQRTCDKHRKCKAPLPAERLVIIKRMMAEGLWRSGDSEDELAAEWEVDGSTVRRSAAEASRAIRLQLEDSQLAQRLLTVLWDNVTNARHDRRYEAVVRSAEAIARLVGLDANKPPPPDANLERPAAIRFIEATPPDEGT